jgi:hypothetical protein
MVYSDRGNQLVAAAGGMDPLTEEDSLDWEALESTTGVKWTFTPSEAQWKNRRAEALVKGTKFTMRTTFKTCHMDMKSGR